MNNFNVVGDIAGNFKTLQALLAKMPQDAELISLGDPNDRGPRSREVIEFLMSNGRTIQSNHAHMMTTEWRQQTTPGAYPRYYEAGLWPQSNGGMATVFSYVSDRDGYIGRWENNIPEEHIRFLENCPMYIEEEGFIFSHAPIFGKDTLKNAYDLGTGFAFLGKPDFLSDFSLIWNRHVMKKPIPDLNGKISIFGHNSSDDVKVYSTKYPQGIHVFNSEGLKLQLDENEVYAICLDTSKPNYNGTQKLTGLHIPTMELFYQEYID